MSTTDLTSTREAIAKRQPPEPQAPIYVQPADVVRPKLAAVIFGFPSERAIEGLIYRGRWREGKEYHRAPDDSVWVDVAGVRAWVIGNQG